jgi:uncharacterized membrane protein
MFTRILAAFVALVVGVILLQFGFWEAVFLLTCAAIGWWIADRYVGQASFGDFLDRLFPERRRRR